MGEELARFISHLNCNHRLEARLQCRLQQATTQATMASQLSNLRLSLVPSTPRLTLELHSLALPKKANQHPNAI